MRSSMFSDQQLDVSLGGYSGAGTKAVNQDAFAACLPSSTELKALKGAVLCIADGVSSSSRSAEASQMLVQEFIDEYYSTSNTVSVRQNGTKVLSALNAWFCSQNQALIDEVDDTSLVSTFSAVVIKGHVINIFHVGDSRVYLLRDGRLRQLTEDHVRRYSGRWVLSRAIGIDRRLEIAIVQEQCQIGDQIVLTTDGVHETFSEADLAQQLNQLLSEHSAEEAASILCARAVERGSEDNVSCLIANVLSLQDETIDETAARLTTRKIPPVMSPGMRIDHYRVLSVLHNSTRSCLYLVANEQEEDAQYVLKAPSRNFTEDLTYLEGFVREQWFGQHLNHRSIMRTYPSNDSAFLYSINEYIPGGTLAQWILDNPRPSLPQVRKILVQIIDGLRVLQRQGIVHRDIKPDNFMIDKHGAIKLIDLGTLQAAGLEELSALAGEDRPVGSVNYIAPEYLLTNTASMRSDLFSLGCMVYEMLCGYLPYKMDNVARRTPDSYAAWHYISLRKYRADIPEWVDLTLKKATAPNIEQRYLGYSEFLAAMQQPSEEVLQAVKRQPLMARNPARFWQLVSAVLAGVIVLQSVLS